MSWKRFLVLGIIQGLIIIHVIQWLVTGKTTTPIEPSEAIKTVSEGVVNVGAIFFALALLSTLVFGRFFCGWACHIVLLQDACTVILNKLGIRPRPFRSRLLLWLPLGLALYMFVWPLFHRFAIAPWITTGAEWPGFTWEFTTSDFWRSFPGLMMAIPFLGVCGFLTVYVLGNKGYCTYACPYGGFFAPFEQVSPVRIRLRGSCDDCGQCTAACTSNVQVHQEVKNFGMIVDAGCMKCMDCVSVCHNDALKVGLGKPAIAIPAEERAAKGSVRYDMSWTEEIIFAVIAVVTLLSLRGAYALPLLFSSGVAAIVTWMAWKSWSIIRKRSDSFNRMQLKTRGKLKIGGWVFLVITGFTLFMIANVGVANIAWLKARMHDDRVEVPANMVFSGNAIMPSEEVAEHARTAIEWYQRAGFVGDGGWSLFPSTNASFSFAARQAWLHSVLLEYESAMAIVDGLISRHGIQQDLAMGRARLIRIISPLDAGPWIEGTLDEHPEFVEMRDEHITNLLREEGPEAAIAQARIGMESMPSSLLSMRRLAVLLLDFGGQAEFAESAEITRKTIEIAPDNPGAWRAYAMAQAKMGDLEAADASMRQAIEIAPEDHRLRAQYARLLNDRGLRAMAEAELAEATRLAEEQGFEDMPQPLPPAMQGPMLP